MKRWVSLMVSVTLLFSFTCMNVCAIDESNGVTIEISEVEEESSEISETESLQGNDPSNDEDSNEYIGSQARDKQQDVQESVDDNTLNVDQNESGSEDLTATDDAIIPDAQNSSDTSTSSDELPNNSITSFTLNEASNTISEIKTLSENNISHVYVSSNGSATGTGTSKDPVSTIADALKIVENGGTIHLLTDITQTSMVLLNDFSVTIDGGNHTIYRSKESFTKANDARGGYHPALFEVANDSVFTLRNVILDDQYHTMGTQYLEQTTGEEKHNEYYVQDAMIALYDGHAHDGQIILDSGAIIRNYGGMSAIRVTAQPNSAHHQLIMKSGSKIIDDDQYQDGKTRGFGAIWSQGANVLVEEGASIENIHGGIIYAEDGANITYNGNIKDISLSPMSFGKTNTNGLAEHGRYTLINSFNSTLHFGATSRIESFDLVTIPSGVVNYTSTAFLITGSKATFDEGSVITNVNGGVIEANGSIIHLNGRVENCNGNGNILFRLRGNGRDFTLGKTGEITSCQTSDVGLFYVQAYIVNIDGHIFDNHTPGQSIIYLAPVGGGQVTLNLNETSVIEDNSASQYVVKFGEYSIVNLNGGVIHNNSVPAFRFKLVSWEANKNSSLNLNSGIVENNGSDEPQVTIEQNKFTVDDDNIMRVNEGVIVGDSEFKYDFGNLTVADGYTNISLGYLEKGTADGSINAYFQKYIDNSDDFSEIVENRNGIYFKPSTEQVTFIVELDTPIAKDLPIYGLLTQLDAVGKPANSDVLTYLAEKLDDHTLMFTLNGLTPLTSYALSWAYASSYSISPSAITIYTGGNQAEDTYCNIGTGPDCTGGLPVNNFTFEGLPSEGTLQDAFGNTFSFASEKELESLLKQYVSIRYIDSQGNALVNDTQAGEYISRLSSDALQIKETNDSTYHQITFTDGQLIIRYIENKQDAQSGAIMYDAIPSSQQPSETDVITTPLVVYDESTDFYTNNQDDLIYPKDDQYREGIALLDDDLLEGNDNRRPHLQDRAVDQLVQLGVDTRDKQVNYDFHYLDLVDTNNANAWVSSSQDVDVYLPYPSGLTSDTEFYILHFKDLHREYGIAGEENVIDAINNSEVEVVKYENNENWIKFCIPRSGFSPFLIVWTSDKPVVEPEQPNEPSNPGTWDDGGPFTTDECGSVYDRWGNLIYQGVCEATGFMLVNTKDN